jgi:hypothetical protein
MVTVTLKGFFPQFSQRSRDGCLANHVLVLFTDLEMDIFNLGLEVEVRE